tara:strand:+ start:180 stop:362 length:183 start_codon:yes stop_codon:yes gene_type:complete
LFPATYGGAYFKLYIMKGSDELTDLSWKVRPELKPEDLNIKTETKEEVDSIRIKSYKYAF